MERTRLIQARLRKRWTQGQAAGFAGVDPKTYRQWERGATSPRPSSMQQLCEAFGLSTAELGFDEEIVAVVTPQSSILIDNDLTLRLLSVAFVSLPYQTTQRQIASILEEHDMNGDTVTRRTALAYLASLPFIASLGAPIPKQRIDDIIMQCNAGIAACWALSKSGDDADLALSMKGASEYARHLKPVVKETESTPYCKVVAELVTQVEMLQTVLGWHRINPLVAMEHGNEAVKYSEIAGDVFLQLNALKLLTWACYYGRYHAEALQCMQKAALLAKQHRIPPQAQSGLDGTLAIAQALNGQSATAALLHAEQGVLSKVDMPDYMMDPLAAHLTKAGLALYLQRDYGQAMAMLKQVVDPDTLEMKHPLPERFRVEALNIMILSALKLKQKDKEHIKQAWKVAMNGTLQLQSKQRFNEAAMTYGIMEALWPDDPQIIDEFRPLVINGIN